MITCDMSKLLCRLLAAWLALAPAALEASQATLVTPAAPLPMTSLAGFLNAALLSVGSCQKGPSAPTNGTGGVAFAGECWANDTTSTWPFAYYDGASWVTFGSLNSSTHAWTIDGVVIGGATPAAGGFTTLTLTSTGTVTNTAAPGSPASGKVAFWTDSTDLRFHDKNSAGVIGTTVVAYSAVTHQFLTGMSAAGAFTGAQPAAADLSNGTTGSGGGVVLATAPTVSGATLSGGPNISQNVLTTGVITPTALSGAVNDYNPSGLATASVIRQDGGAADRNITGLTAQPGGTEITIFNVGTSNALILKNQNASSVAANRFLFGADITLAPNQAAHLWYDSTTGRWVAKATFTVSGGSPAGTVTSAQVAAGQGIAVTGTCTITTSGTCTVAVNLSEITNSLSGDVSLNNTGTYFDGPSVAQGATGTWLASGTVTLGSPTADNHLCKLWDGTTTIASLSTENVAGTQTSATLSGYLAAPAGNIRISCKDASTTGGKIFFNASGNSKDSTISAIRIN